MPSNEPEKRPDPPETVAWPGDQPQEAPVPPEAATLVPTPVAAFRAEKTENVAHLKTDAGPTVEEVPLPLPTVPGYAILEEIGRGGMGVVYRAMDQRLKRPVALKMILVGDHSAKEMRSRFRAEAEAVAQLQHPNIVQIYETGEHNGLPYFALEYVSGGSLTDLLKGKPLPAASAAKLLHGLAQAVQCAHEHGIVHRDLKPANVLLFNRDAQRSAEPDALGYASWLNEVVPKVTDFGLAKRLGDSGQQHTRTGSILGTPSYMSPEQAEGRNRDVGPATDIWALGAIFYEMLTGRPPFVGSTPVDTIMQITHDDPLPPLRLQPRLPRDLDTIALKCLQRDPAKRYRSAGDLAEDLDRYLKGKPIHARPIGPLERAGKWVRRQPALAALLAVSVLAVLTGLGVVSWYNARLQGLLSEVQKQHDQTRHQVIRLSTARGTGLANEGRYLEALPWLAEALRLEDNAEAQVLQRIRLGTTLRRCPVPQRIWFHEGRTLLAALSPDGRWMLSACSDRQCQVWDQHDPDGGGAGRPAHDNPLPARPTGTITAPAPIQSATFSPDSKYVVLACEQGKAQVWKFPETPREPILLKHDGTVYHAVFSPDSKRIATASVDGTARVWDLEGRELASLPHPDEVYDVQFSPDGQRLLTACQDGKARIWEWVGKQPPLVLPGGSPVWVASWSPDGRRVATGTRKGKAQIWNSATGQPVGKQMSHNGTILWLVFSRDGRLVATASEDNSARVWGGTSGVPMTSRLMHGSTVYQAVLSPDNSKLVTASDDNTAQVWDVATGEKLGSPLLHNGTVSTACFSPDGQVLTASADGTVRLWTLSPCCHGTFQMKHQGPVRQVSCTRDGSRLLTASEDGTTRIWDSSDGRQLQQLDQAQGNGKQELALEVIEAHFSSDETWIATASSNGLVRFWTAADGRPLKAQVRHGGAINGMSLSPDSRLVVTAGKDHVARLWHSANGEPTGVVLAHQGEVNGAWFDPQGKRVLTASADGTARIWDVGSGEPLTPPLKHEEAVRHAAWNYNGTRVVTASNDRTGRVWDAATGKAVTPPLLHNGAVTFVAFNSNGQLVATGSEDNTARVWDSTSGKHLTRPLPHQGSVHKVLFSPDDRLAVTSSSDSSACVWDLWLELPVTPPLEHQVDVVDVIFLPDGQKVVTASLDTTARLWRLNRDDRAVSVLVQIAQALSGGAVDAESGFTRLQTSRLQELWQEVRKRYPGETLTRSGDR